MSFSLGGSQSNSRQRTSSRPYFHSTGNSRFNGAGVFTLDPSTRGFQEQSLAAGREGQAGQEAAAGRFGESLGGLRSQLFGNQDPYMQARIAPTQERFAQERGQLAQDIGRRGLGGSSFGQQAQTAQATTQERDLANQRALATQESIQAGVGIDQLIMQADMMAAQGNLQQAELLRAIANDRASTELDIFGLGTQGQTRGTTSQVGVSVAGNVPGTN